MNTYKISAATSVDKGLVRNNNEDNFFLNGTFLNANNRDASETYSSSSSSSLQLCGVFDGMGGEAMGEEASHIIAQVMNRCYKRLSVSGDNQRKLILDAVNDANTRICKKILDSGERRIGATFAGIVIDENTATVYNIGDSRVYMLRNDELKQISVDDTTAQRLVNLGMITEEEAKTHKDRHKLTQHLGIFRDEMVIEPHISETITIEKGDKFLLCSDGLTDMLEDDEIEEILRTNKSPEELSKALVKAALDNGGVDNVTANVIIVNEAVKAAAPMNKKLVAVCAAVLVCFVAVGAFLLSSGSEDEKDAPVQGSSTGDEVVVDSIRFNQYVEEAPIGGTGSFLASTQGVGRAKVSYISTNPEIMYVDQKTGEYTAVQEGTTTVYANAGERSCSVKVQVYVPVTDITGMEQNVSLKVGEKHTVEYEIEPANAVKDVTFTSSDIAVATVSAKGVITAKKAGKAEITVAVKDYSEIIEVVVTKPAEDKKTDKDDNSGKDGKNDKTEPKQPTQNAEPEVKQQEDKPAATVETPTPKAPAPTPSVPVEQPEDKTPTAVPTENASPVEGGI